MNEIRLPAFGKVNLGLDIIRRRFDGYHEVDMILQTVDLCDWITLRTSDSSDIRLTVNTDTLAGDENNLVYRAIRLLKEEFHISNGIDAYLEKNLPVAAGMAGGSTDAAAALVGMNRLFSLGLSVEELQKRGLLLGADVPFCIVGGTWHAGGIGEKLTRLPSPPDCHVVIAKPPIGVSTKFVYENLAIDTRGDYPHVNMAGVQKGLEQKDLSKICSCLGNVLETVTEPAYPIISEIKNVLQQHGAMAALMSGSGPTVFGIFSPSDKEEARKACEALATHNDVFLTRFCENGGLF